MKNRLLFFFPIIIGLAFLFQSCSSGDSVIIAGQVIDANSGNAIENAIVEITAPSNLGQTVATDSAGNFSFDVDPGSETVTLTVEIDKESYQRQTTSFKITSGTDVDNLIIELQKTGSSDGGGGGEGEDAVGGEAGKPNNLELVGITNSSIAIRGTGGDEESTFTFIAKDSAGRPVDQGNEVAFSIIRGPNGGEFINPTTAFTNSEGRVKASIASGDSAGVVKIEASINRQDLGTTIRSNPVLVAIGNGFPESQNFRIAPVNTNFEAWGLIASSESTVRPNVIVASLGDYRNNPVLPGTAVDFTTDAGIITANALTDEEGIALVELRPDGSTPTGHPRGIAFATITARTVDINDNYIESQADILFTSRNPSISLNPSTVNIPANGSQSFTMTVNDINGYPVAAGSEISVTTSAGTSNTFGSITLGDFTSPGPGSTEFGFTVSDADDQNPTEQEATVTITVTLPSGALKSVTF